jgi:hypothetical protein
MPRLRLIKTNFVSPSTHRFGQVHTPARTYVQGRIAWVKLDHQAEKSIQIVGHASSEQASPLLLQPRPNRTRRTDLKHTLGPTIRSAPARRRFLLPAPSRTPSLSAPECHPSQCHTHQFTNRRSQHHTRFAKIVSEFSSSVLAANSPHSRFTLGSAVH